MVGYYIKNFFQFIKRFILFFIIIILVLVLIGGMYIGIQDIFATRAKDYLNDKYDLDKAKFYAIKTTEYVYEKDMQCDSLWFKKCTDNENLEKSITFVNFKKEKIKVKMYKDGSFEDDYNGEIRKEYLEELEKKNKK